MSVTPSKRNSDSISELKRYLRRLQNSVIDAANLDEDQVRKLHAKANDYKKGIEKLVAGLTGSDLLLPISTIDVPAIGTFIARDHISVDRGGEACITYIDYCFARDFLDKTEEPVGATTLRINQLREDSTDGPIISALGNEQIAETTLGQMHNIIKRWACGEQTNLRDDIAYANMWYIRNIYNELQPVQCYLFADSHSCQICSITNTIKTKWKNGIMILSH